MTLKKIGYVKDFFKYVDCFKLTCWTNIPHVTDECECEILVKEHLYFNNTEDILPCIEQLVIVEKQLKAWKRWIDEDVHSPEEYEEVWDGKEHFIIPSFQQIYAEIQNKAIEQFKYVSIMKLINSGFSIKYIDKEGYENDLDVV